ncbi:MAG: cysteine-rich CWC family protein [Kiloniellales bacterium]
MPACPNCERTFNCTGPPDCWCLNVERKFDYEEFIIRTGMSSCVCPVCLTGKETDGARAGEPAK